MNSNKELNKALDDMQKGMDFSYVTAEVKGETLTSEQKAAKDRMLGNLRIMETPEHEARVQELFASC